MRIIKLAWIGTRTQNAEVTVAFFRDVLGLRLELEQAGFWMLKLPDGSKVEVFGADSPINRHFTTGPVAGFLVDNVQDAAAELRAAGVEILLESPVDDSGNAWAHFRGPDGHIYEFTQDPGRLPTPLKALVSHERAGIREPLWRPKTAFRSFGLLPAWGAAGLLPSAGKGIRTCGWLS